jgi:hypothetical protein
MHAPPKHWSTSTRIHGTISQKGQSCRSELEWGEGGSEEQSLVAVCGGCPMLQIGVTRNVD